LAKKISPLLAKQSTTCAVGYDAFYALTVHEQPPKARRTGQSKYLEEPARKSERDASKAAAEVYKGKDDLPPALLAAGKLILAESQRVVPVDTGFLKSTGFATLESASV
jgi:hypothetical protein